MINKHSIVLFFEPVLYEWERYSNRYSVRKVFTGFNKAALAAW